MKINDIALLFPKQLTLDQTILSSRQLNYDLTWQRRYIALLVEIGELANTTRCFKFWSHKGMEEKGIILEEFCDVLHFTMSLGLTFNYIVSEISLINKDINDMFAAIFEQSFKFYQEKSFSQFQLLFSLIISLALNNLGFSEVEIVNGYYQKNKINYQRQEDNY